VIIRKLGRVDYLHTWQAMRAFTDARTPDTEDELWVCEHPPVFTQGVAGKPEHLLFNPTHIPVIKTDRGGQITYHGPGQVMVYILLNLKRRGFGVRELVMRIENAVIALLAAHGVMAYGKRDAPGVYVRLSGPLSPGERVGVRVAAVNPTLVGTQRPSPLTPRPSPGQALPPRGEGNNHGASSEAKIAALGLKVRNGHTYHGLAFNVDMDLTPFSAINPCGYEGLRVTHLHELGVHLSQDAAGAALADELRRQLSAPAK
jgi:lipoyl(octanoyl) transferase